MSRARGGVVFSELVVAYLFLGGTGAGALLIAAVLMLLADERAGDGFQNVHP